jgi:cold shock CspA family protein
MAAPCRSAGIWTFGPGSPRDATKEEPVAQGTIKDFDDGAVTGSLLTDDRVEIAIDARSIEGSNIRTLRLGQRVAFDVEELDGSPVARGLRLVTFD